MDFDCIVKNEMKVTRGKKCLFISCVWQEDKRHPTWKLEQHNELMWYEEEEGTKDNMI